MQSLLQLKNIRIGSLYWIQVSYAIKNIVEIIMMPPQQTEEYLLKSTIGHMIFKQGRFFANDFICSMQALMWHQFIAERYSYSMDFWYSICLRLVSHGIPMIIMSLISYSIGYITPKLVIQQITFNSQWFNNLQSCYELLGLNTQLCLAATTIYYICKKLKLETIKVFIFLGCFSIFLRSIIVYYLHSNNLLHDYSLRYLTDTNTITQFYHFCFGFASGEYLNKFETKSKMLFNQPLQIKTVKIHKEINLAIEYSCYFVLLICVYLDSVVQLSSENTQISSTQLLFARLLTKPTYGVIIWVLINTQEIQFSRNIQQKKESQKGKFIIPGYTQPHLSMLAAQPLSALIRLSVGQTVIGPYHPRIFIMLAIGVLVFQHFLGEICMNLFNWFMQDIYGSVSNYFDNKKRQRISRLIKESIYSGTE
ncbi:Conserved_hypothetical protein [Hexamita inflata]|uniref:SecY-type transporter protein n=1 Tax=Hexamita inflata TaxID=28002 RepID=A0ABP1H953_9EUKA